MPRKKSSARRPSPKTKIFLALLTTLNLALSLALSLQRRRQVLRAISTDKGVLLTQQSDFTKSPK